MPGGVSCRSSGWGTESKTLKRKRENTYRYTKVSVDTKLRTSSTLHCRNIHNNHFMKSYHEISRCRETGKLASLSIHIVSFI